MTAPLTPPDCDLRGLSYMPLDVQRLRDSDLALISSGDEFKAAVLLWSVSWTQVPAASLPNDDRLLAALVRMDAKAWRKVREVALRGWQVCDDGRLYHSVVAEKACEAWKDRTAYREKRDKDRARLEAWRAAQKQAVEPDGNGIGNAVETPNETRFDTRSETLPEEEGTGSRELKEEEATASLSPEATEPGTKYPELFEAAWSAYAHVKGRSSKKLTHAAWKRLPTASREALPAACARYSAEGREPKMDCGAPAMDRWIRDEKFTDWLAANAPIGVDWPDSRWAVAVDLWRADGAWDAGLGPTPGQPGCRVPPHLMVETAKLQPVGRVA